MKRIHSIAALAMLVAVTASPAAAATTGGTGIGLIPLRLTDAEPSYLGVRLFSDPDRPTRDARLPIRNDGSHLAIWGSSLPLQVIDARVAGPFTEFRVRPLGFNLENPQDNPYDFTYTVRLSSDQRESLLYFGQDIRGSFFGGTLYINAILQMTDIVTGAISEQALDLALNVDGKWVDEPAACQLDNSLSSLLPFTELDASGQLKDDYTCVYETHPLGYYCLQISPALLSDLNSQ